MPGGFIEAVFSGHPSGDISNGNTNSLVDFFTLGGLIGRSD